VRLRQLTCLMNAVELAPTGQLQLKKRVPHGSLLPGATIAELSCSCGWRQPGPSTVAVRPPRGVPEPGDLDPVKEGRDNLSADTNRRSASVLSVCGDVVACGAKQLLALDAVEDL
jgi:hypothetical protein